MAHMQKYKAGAIPAMIHHYDRDREGTLKRDNIDEERTHLNYGIGEQRGREYVDARVAEVEESQGRAVRSDAVRMADWVITLPPDVREGDERKFFEAAYEFMERRYGADNMLGGRVHMDETTPHMHAPLVPVVERRDGRLSLSAHDMLSRSDLRTFHKDLADFEEHALGYRPQVLLDESQKIEKGMSGLGQEEYKAARERLERLRGAESSAGARNRELEEEKRRVEGECRREQGRERQIAEVTAERAEALGTIRKQVRQAGRRAEVLSRAAGFARQKVGELREKLAKVEARIRETREMIRERLAERHEMGQDRNQQREAGQEWQEREIGR